MATSFATFERLKDKGIAAYKKGEYTTAKTYLVEAAESMIEIAEQAKSPDMRRQHEEYATELIDLAKDCEAQRKNRSPRRQRATDSDDKGADPSEWIVKEKPKIGFDDIAGLEDVKDEIRLKMIYPLSHPALAQKYGISAGGGVLLYGPPGTGKTMMAKAIAHELDATFFVISPAQILSKWVGEAEQNLKKLFDSARAEKMSVIFMDEIEALVPRRKSGGSSVMQRVVPQILQELEGFQENATPLLFVGATNKPWMLDDAMMRPGRLDARIYIPLPDAPARFKLLELYMSNRPMAEDVNFGELCDRLEGYSGADIAGIAEQAARFAFMESIAGKDSRQITMKDILQVIEATLPSVKPVDLARYERFTETGR
ncbi:MAG: ATP-binding protein [Planctomycetes bacterium]|nr:ATP-binding protein [Planctomycetota bacterium]